MKFFEGDHNSFKTPFKSLREGGSLTERSRIQDRSDGTATERISSNKLPVSMPSGYGYFTDPKTQAKINYSDDLSSQVFSLLQLFQVIDKRKS